MELCWESSATEERLGLISKGDCEGNFVKGKGQIQEDQTCGNW